MRRTHLLVTLATLSTLALLLCLAPGAQARTGTAVVKKLIGTATCTDALGMERPLTIGAVLKEGETVKTGPDASVDLYLAENGPGVGLEADTILRLTRLGVAETTGQVITDTLLDLQAGALYGIVNKLSARSNFRVKTPRSEVVVRGTEFFINATTGAIYVMSGTVTVTLVLNITGMSEPLTRTIAVSAGQQLELPRTFSQEYFDNLAASPLPGKQTRKSLLRLAALGQLTRYTSPDGQSEVRETFSGRTVGGKQGIQVNRPPTQIQVSP